MLVRLLWLLALAWPLGMAHGAEAVPTGKLGDDALMTKLQATQKSIQELRLQRGDVVPPDTVAPQLAELDAMIELAENPLGDAALGARLVRTQLYQASGQFDRSEAELKAVIAGGGAPKGVSAAFYLLAIQYLQVGGKDAEIIALAAAAEKHQIDPEVIGALQGMARHFSMAPGTAFPEISFVDLAGAKRAISDYRGKILLVDAWATWCPECVRDMPRLKEIYAAYHARGFEIVGISLDKDRAKLDAFIKDRDIPWPQSFEGKGWDDAIAKQLGIHRLPSAFLVDAAGKVIAKDIEDADDLERAVGKAIDSLPPRERAPAK